MPVGKDSTAPVDAEPSVASFVHARQPWSALIGAAFVDLRPEAKFWACLRAMVRERAHRAKARDPYLRHVLRLLAEVAPVPRIRADSAMRYDCARTADELGRPRADYPAVGAGSLLGGAGHAATVTASPTLARTTAARARYAR